MRILIAAVAVLASAAAVAAESDPGAALMEARKLIAGGQHRQAVALLEPAQAQALAIPEPAQRTQALSALHFYTAVAYSGAGDEENARKYLQQFFLLTPNARRLDPKKYDPKFLALFDELVPGGGEGDTKFTFVMQYPNWQGFRASTAVSEALETWDRSPALQLLGSNQEKREWRAVALRSPAEREQFITEFWKRRDPTPTTDENEFRMNFIRRVAFANQEFASNDALGAMSDRGRVFILLGEPSFVRRRPITTGDNVSVVDLSPLKNVDGTMEHWVYSKDQIPGDSRTPTGTVMYRFVTQRGVGDHVLQKDNVFAMNALAKAAEVARKGPRAE
jgi:GWxTD domain-containing protein